MEIEYITHASLLLRTDQVKILTDPFYFPELDPTLAPSVRLFPPREVDLSSFGHVDYLFSSHEHHDHCHPQTIERLVGQVGTVLLPAERPDLEARFRDAGFSNIRLLENRRPVTLEEGVELTCYWDDPVDTILLVKMEGITVLHANDCAIHPLTLGAISWRCTVDYAFLCSTSTQDLYPLLVPRPAEELNELAKTREDNFFEVSIQRIDALQARVVLPYSYTATYLSPDQLHINGYSRLTPTIYRSRLKERRPSVECWALEPGDVIECETHSIRRIRSESLWGADLPEYMENVRRYSESIRSVLPAFDPGEPDSCLDALRARLQARLDEGVPHSSFYSCLNDAVVIHLIGKTRTASLMLNVSTRTVTTWTPLQEPGEAVEHGLEIDFPASLMEILLAGAYDPFMILYTYRVSFRPQPGLKALGLTAHQEYSLYMGVILTLFMPLDNTLLHSFANMDEILGLQPVGARRPREDRI